MGTPRPEHLSAARLRDQALLARSQRVALRRRRFLLLFVVCAALLSSAVTVAMMATRDAPLPELPQTQAFQLTWEYLDRPVADGLAQRTWLWGPAPISDQIAEEYADAPDGRRLVQYWDKGRMELTARDGEPGVWEVTQGLLVVEMATGRLQLGERAFDTRPPATINVAGDPHDETAPTYATFGLLMDEPPLPDGALITQRVTRDGTVTDDPQLASYGVTAAYRVRSDTVDHQVASVFWEFMNGTGPVYLDGEVVTERLFEQPFASTGYPIAEAYWTEVSVEGTTQLVLIQCFERRCLTYTPLSEQTWQVESGNVGRHYYAWRYGE